MQQPKRRDSAQDDEVEAAPQLPLTDGRYFACRRCRRVLSETQWFTAGCVDCSATMGVPDRDNLLDFATPHFHNFIGLIAPGQSWVARLIMKSRAQTNGIFAENLSDDESAEADEEDALADRYLGEDDDDAVDEEEDAVVEEREAPASAGYVNPFATGDVDEVAAQSLGSAAEPIAEAPVSANDASATAFETMAPKRVKLEVDADALRSGLDV